MDFSALPSTGSFKLNGKFLCAPLAPFPANNPEMDPAFIDWNIRTTLNDPSFPQNYHAPDRDFGTIAEILNKASGESLFPDGEKNARFLKIKSLMAARCATAFVVGESKLKFSKVGKCTHLLESAAIALNMRSTLPHLANTKMTREEAIEKECLPAYEFLQDKTVTDDQLREIIAFVAYCHDHQEDFLEKYPFMTAEYLVKHCWMPFCLPENKKHAAFVTYLLHQLTDPPGSREWPKHERLGLQLETALADPTGIVGLIRYAEKSAMLARDLYAYEKNPSYKLAEKIRKNSKRRRHLMRQYPVAKYFAYYEKLILELEDMIPEVKEMKAKRKFRKTNPRPKSRYFRAQMTAFGGNMAAPSF